MRRAFIAAGCVTCFALVTEAATPACAQAPGEIAQAKKWFKEAEQAEKKGDCKSAIDLFRRALDIKDTAQLHLRIGNCQEKLGDLVAAQGSYQRSLDRAMQAKLGNVADVARDELEDLKPRVPSVTLTMKETPGELALKLDGLPLAASSINSPLLLNPGDHTVFAVASGRGTFSKTFNLSEKERATVAIELPEDTGDGVAPPVIDAAPASTSPRAEAPPAAPPGPSVLAVALLAGGGAAVLGGVVLTVASFVKDADIDERCGGSARTKCPASERVDINADISSANVFRGVGFGLAGVGLVAGGVGVALLLTAPKKQQAPASLFIAPSAGGISLRGRF